MPLKTNTDVEVNFHGYRITIPKGTVVLMVRDGLGNPQYAVRDASLIVELTGDTHTPVYYYCWIDAQYIDLPVEPQPQGAE